MTYKEKLLDPRWQRKRALVMIRDNFQCQECESTDITLHVHHLRYFKNTDPWDYDDSHLITLCADCHAKAHGKYSEKVSIIERQYEELKPIEGQPDVLISVNQQINALTRKLSEGPEIGLETEILKNLMFLYETKKNLTKED